ncbi:MAG: hypothetical protein B7Y39_04420 [Bdellovibrio sp. 28-41-41]|nr:MAG: hypothetical protein B7Y39_04420 [Bdellovibrio sp. 28-41-41]
MCFSATASFVAGISLSVVGVATLNQARTKSEIPIAIIPLMFGVQQLIEGVIWLTFHTDAAFLRQVMTYIYSVFSHVLWPIYIPFAIGILEAVNWRKKMILAFGVIGISVGLYLLYFIVVFPVAAEVIEHHIVYVSPHFYSIPVMVLYVATTCFSCFFSSHGFFRMFGGLAFLAFVTSFVIDKLALFSIWCFFAAVLSLIIYFHLRYRNWGGFPKITRVFG